jgi:hypothetical protein
MRLKSIGVDARIWFLVAVAVVIDVPAFQGGQRRFAQMNGILRGLLLRGLWRRCGFLCLLRVHRTNITDTADSCHNEVHSCDPYRPTRPVA